MVKVGIKCVSTLFENSVSERVLLFGSFTLSHRRVGSEILCLGPEKWWVKVERSLGLDNLDKFVSHESLSLYSSNISDAFMCEWKVVRIKKPNEFLSLNGLFMCVLRRETVVFRPGVSWVGFPSPSCILMGTSCHSLPNRLFLSFFMTRTVHYRYFPVRKECLDSSLFSLFFPFSVPLSSRSLGTSGHSHQYCHTHRDHRQKPSLLSILVDFCRLFV